MDLSVNYLGLDLPHPLMVGASPLVDDLDMVLRIEDAGSAAIVMHSLFEEQLTSEQLATHHHVDAHEESFAEALSYLPEPADFKLGPDEYLEQLRRIKERVSVPVIASLNGTTAQGWLEHARLIEQAGADALELNVYFIVTEAAATAASVEEETVRMVESVNRATGLPVAVKLSPFYTALPSFARRLADAGASALILFNRIYQPDIDVEALEVERTLRLSTSAELHLRIQFLAMLWGRIDADLAVTGGVHTAVDAVKSVMAGATVVQMVSAVLERGPDHLTRTLEDFTTWLEEHEYESVSQMCGSMSLERCPDPHAYQRGNYLRILQSWGRVSSVPAPSRG